MYVKLKNAPVGSTILFNGNEAIVISHGLMGSRVEIVKSKNDNISLGKQVLSNLSKVSILKKRGK